MWHVSAGRGTPVVLVHGALCDWRWWEPQLAALAAQGQAVAVSLSGYQPTPPLPAEQFSADRHVAELGAFLQGFGAPVHLVGHSRGGRIAMHVAARVPAAVRSLVLIEPGGEIAPGFLPAPAPPAPPSSASDVRPRVLARVQDGDADGAMRLYIDAGHGAGRWDRLPQPIRRIIIDNAGTIAGMVHDKRAAAFTAAAARAIACPTLLMVGAASPPVFGRIVEALAGHVPDQRRQTMAGADHFLTWEHAAAVNDALTAWLQGR